MNIFDRIIKIYSRRGVSGVFDAVRFKLRCVYFYLLYPGEVLNRNDYGDWLRRYEKPLKQQYPHLLSKLDKMTQAPVISVVLMVKDCSNQRLNESIDSIILQLYSRWELFVLFDKNTHASKFSTFEGYNKNDPRIKIINSPTDSNICTSLNALLEQMTGEWFAILNAKDLMSEIALYSLIETINKNPEAKLFYSDMDKINESGNRLDPYFKPDWNQTLFYTQYMISHSTFYHIPTVRNLGGFRDQFSEMYEFDLALRYMEVIRQDDIYHIPQVLFHLRTHGNSVTRTINIPEAARESGVRALNEHFQRLGVNAHGVYAEPGFRIKYALPKELPLVSLIIPTKNGLKFIRECVTSILQKTSYGNYEIIIIDNGSDDPATLKYFATLDSEPHVRVIRDDSPFNYSALNNSAVKLAKGDIVGFINNDIAVITPEWLSELVSIAMQSGVGVVGACLWYPDDTLQHGGVILGIGSCAGHAHKGHEKGDAGYYGRMALMSEFSAVTAACFIVKKELYEKVGGLNEIDLQVACNDIDFCLRVRELGYRNVWTPYAELYHFESATRGYEDTPEKKARLSREADYIKQKWGRYLVNDPAYNQNLTLDSEDFGFAWPPRVH